MQHLLQQWKMYLMVFCRHYDENPIHPSSYLYDEKPLQLLADARRKIKWFLEKPNVLTTIIRKGTCSIFLFTEPLNGWVRRSK
jgi:hypothetical protein